MNAWFCFMISNSFQKKIFFRIVFDRVDEEVSIVDDVRDDDFCFKVLKTRFEHRKPKQMKRPGRELTISNIIHSHVCPTINATSNKTH